MEPLIKEKKPNANRIDKPNSFETLTDPNVAVSKKALKEIPHQINFRICWFFAMAAVVGLWGAMCFNSDVYDKQCYVVEDSGTALIVAS